MAVVSDRDGQAAVERARKDVGGSGRRADERLRVIKRWCDERAVRKREWVLRIAPLRQTEMPHEKVRLRVGLTVEEYRRAKRWMNEALSRCAASSHPIPLSEALEDIAAHHVATALRVGIMKEQGRTREQIRETLKLSDEEFDLADEWWRDGMRAAVEPDPDE